jgi:hypothetical protein
VNPGHRISTGCVRGGQNKRATPEDGTIAVSDAKRKIYAKRLILISALLLIIFGIVAIYMGAANLWRWMWWLQNHGDYTDSGMWTKEAILSYKIWGAYFVTTGVLGAIGGLVLWFKALPAVAEDNKAYLRKILLPIAIIGFPAGVIAVGFMLLFVWLMYRDDRYDFFGLLLEDVTRAKKRIPTPMSAQPTEAGRDLYATGYQEQQGLYTDDYSQAAYGAGKGAYTAGGDQSLVDLQPATPAPAAAAPAATPPTAPACKGCGKATEWIEEYGRFYCYDCDAYV